MGEEADADWQSGLVEWGAETVRGEYLEHLEYNLKHGTRYQRRVARELLLRFLEGRRD